MANRGYVYVMINPSYNGFVKIGKTIKDPEERAKELSSATGVATPFIVVYKRLFNNCDVAEKLVHSILEEKGYRVNNSREFFSIGTSDAINVILNIPDSNESYCSSNNINDSNENLADVYYSQAEDYEKGRNNTFQDIDKAFFLYKKSAELGRHDAYFRLGRICLQKDKYQDALDFFHIGANYGDCSCYAELGKLYIRKGEPYYNKKNADLAWTKYFENIDKYQETRSEYVKILIEYDVVWLLIRYLGQGEKIIELHEKYIYKYIRYVYNGVFDLIEYLEKHRKDSMLSMLRDKIIPYLESLEAEYEYLLNSRNNI